MKTLKKTVTVLSALAIAGGLLAGCGAKETAGGTEGEKKAEGKKYTFRLADTHPADYPTVIGDKKFAELVNERTNGRIKIDVFPGAQLGEEKAVLEQVQLGAIEFTRVSSGPLGEFSKGFGVFSLPYVFDSDQHLWKFLESEAGNKMLDSLEGAKMKGLAYYSSGARSFYSRKPIASLADLKGQKIRVIQNKINIDLVAALGGSATPMPYGEVFSSLQTGVIDAAENNFPSYQSSNHFEVAKNMILDGHQRVPEVLLISQTAWNKLGEEDRKILKQAALDSVKTQREAWDKYEKEAEAKVRAAGATITEVKDLKPWQDAVKPVIEKYRADYKEALDAIDAARK
ncbi:TRAP dicarboxylate transporter subunit DctP [Paenibacillus mucilaginosus 3016]|uniref:TRAP dicarboxylate transporter subunit DctP n=1 Tax=Paenibacillus mucilaginosus 3016 TaxID=1116391 RepID=H6NS53_9BACL|nr:TRAP transporter substrate-binding protein DctP [Paenibacillus mucilaginosus]AFC27347.1 TRAP dicarboxylate transporter subunit DctP [Paenibacillus mucilaginosus 3016]WFA16257.1 DctP family TRAP transporter solute-binding subunit [Paenibacillus mucilaginosus]